MGRKRKALAPSRRYEVLRAGGFACAYCGARPPAATLVVDHVHPVVRGGTDDDSNLVAACVDCNAGKSDRTGTDRTDPFADWVASQLWHAAGLSWNVTEAELREVLTSYTPRQVHAALTAQHDRLMGTADLRAELERRAAW